MTKLREMRIKKGIRSAELARRLSLARATVCIAEKKGLRNSAAARRYAAALGCLPEEVIEL